MNTLLLQSNPFLAAGILLLATLALWATVLLGAACGITYAVKRASPSVTYCIWQFAIAGLLLLPILCLVLPGVPLGFAIPAVSSTTSGSDRSIDKSAPPEFDRSTNGREAMAAANVERHQSDAEHVSDRQPPANDIHREERTASLAANFPARSDVKSNAPNASTTLQFSWSALLFEIWALGVLIQSAWIAKCFFSIDRMVRRAKPIADPNVNASLATVANQFASGAVPRILQSPETQVPFVAGVFRPRILLPENAQHWPGDRLRMMLAHELAHIQRRDVPWQFVARIVAAFYRFHPLVWLAVLGMREERERACDNYVLSSGVAPVDYAAGLVAVAMLLNAGNQLLRPALAWRSPANWKAESKRF